jgi:hypothetical protein
MVEGSKFEFRILLFGLLVGSVLFAKAAVFFELCPVRMLAFVLGGGVIPVLTRHAGNGDYFSHFITYYIKYFLLGTHEPTIFSCFTY